jgi:hypothetical protein
MNTALLATVTSLGQIIWRPNYFGFGLEEKMKAVAKKVRER